MNTGSIWVTGGSKSDLQWFKLPWSKRKLVLVTLFNSQIDLGVNYVKFGEQISIK